MNMPNRPTCGGGAAVGIADARLAEAALGHCPRRNGRAPL